MVSFSGKLGRLCQLEEKLVPTLYHLPLHILLGRMLSRVSNLAYSVGLIIFRAFLDGGSM